MRMIAVKIVRKFESFRFLKRLLLLKSRKVSSASGDFWYFVFFGRYVDTFPFSVLDINSVLRFFEDNFDITAHDLERYHVEFLENFSSGDENPIKTWVHHQVTDRYLPLYLIARSIKPDYVVEFGVKYGVSSKVFDLALTNNLRGFYYGVDPLIPKFSLKSGVFIKSTSGEFLEGTDLRGHSLLVNSDSISDNNLIFQEFTYCQSLPFTEIYFIVNDNWCADVLEYAAKHLIPHFKMSIETNHLVETHLSKWIIKAK